MRHPLKRLFPPLLFLLLISFAGFCQQKPLPKTLLWRISGNGLQEPSYLYGTLHLTDKQLFNFGDSLYYAMENTDGFAIEVHPDSAAVALMNGDFDRSSLRPVNEILSDSDLQMLAKKMEKKLGKKASDITEKDLIDYRDNWIQREMFYGKNKMSVFMDAYLYASARDMGKWVGGIEDVEDQVRAIETLDATSVKAIIEQETLPITYLDRMKQVYMNQDLDGIENFIKKNASEEFEDNVLIKRNGKMAWRMDSLSHVRSSFFAVGAAHLPGDSGLINLLTRKGFLLEPVFSSKKIAAENYPFKKVELPWQTIKNTNDLFTVSMPGQPQTLVPLANSNMQVYMDITSNLYYYAAGFPINGELQNPDSLLNKLTGNYLQQAKVIASSSIERQSIKGKEIFLNKDDIYFRLNVFTHPSGLVFLMLGSPTQQPLNNAIAEKYFNSLSMNMDLKPSSFLFTAYNYPEHAFKIEMPFKPFINKIKNSEESLFISTLYDAPDSKTGEEYLVFVNDIKPGFYIQGSMNSLQSMCDNYLQNFKGEVIVNEHTTFKGFPALHNVSAVNINGRDGLLEIYLFYKGNRNYSVIAFGLKTEESKNNVRRYLESFQLMPYEKAEWATKLSPDGNFSAWLPAALEKKEQSAENENIKVSDHLEYSTYDPAAPLSVYVDAKILSPFFWAKDDTTFLNAEIAKHVDENDSVINKTYFSAKGYTGVDFMISNKNEVNVEKSRLVLQSDTLYNMVGFMLAEDFQLADYKKMFSSFLPTYDDPKPSTIFERKPEALLAALRSTDTVTFSKALSALQDVSFEEKDLLLLMNALIYLNDDFDSSYYENSNASLGDVILRIDTAHSFIPFIEKNYQTLTGMREPIKPFLLELLMKTPTEQSFRLLKKLLLNDPPKLSYQYYLANSFYDSLRLSRQLFPEILQLANDPGLFQMVTYLTGSMLDSNLLKPADILPYKKEFIAQGKSVTAKEEADMDNSFSQYYDLVKILGAINDKESIALLNDFLKFDNKDIRIHAIAALAKKNHRVDGVHLFTIATSDEHRRTLYEELKASGRLDLFPKDFMTQKEMAKSDMYVNAMDEETPMGVTFVKEKTVDYNGKRQRFYLFKIDYSNNSQLGIAGPYAINEKDFRTTYTGLGIYWDASYDAKQTDDQFKIYMQQMEE